MDPLSPAELIAQMADARARTLTLVEGLDAAAADGPAARHRQPAALGDRPRGLLLRVLGAAPAPRRGRRAARTSTASTTRSPSPTTTAGICRFRHFPTPWPTCGRCRSAVAAHLANDPPDARRDYLAQYARVPRGHAHRGLHLHAPDARLPDAGDRHAQRTRRGRPAAWPVTPRFPAASSCSARSPTTASASTTRSGRTRSRCGRSASPGRR